MTILIFSRELIKQPHFILMKMKLLVCHFDLQYRLDTMECESYTGLIASTFKRRYYGHNSSFNNKNSRQTTLSRHCWNLKDNNIQFERKWSILAHAKPYNPVTKTCRLCLKEVYYILYKPETASLNSKSEVFGWCKHRQRWTLANA